MINKITVYLELKIGNELYYKTRLQSRLHTIHADLTMQNQINHAD